MNNTELQALRRLLFFTQPEAAAMISGTSERAWKHWEAGARPVPLDVEARILELAEYRDEFINRVLTNIEETEKRAAAAGATDAAIDVARFGMVYYPDLQHWQDEPAQWRPHQSACAALYCMDERIRLVPFDGPAYAMWLAGRVDSQAMRGVWAANIVKAM